MPRSGCCQRTSASTPITSPPSQVDLGLVMQHELVALAARGAGSLRSCSRALARRAFISGVKNWKFVAARSSWRGTWRCRRCVISSRTVVPSLGYMLMPMLAGDDAAPCRRASTGCGHARRCMLLRRCSAASSGDVRFDSSTTNSSPPRRATVSSARRQARRRCGHCLQQLVAGLVAEAIVDVLKRSRSMNITRERCRRCARRRRWPARGGPAAAAVGQAGQRVVQGQVMQLGVGDAAATRPGWRSRCQARVDHRSSSAMVSSDMAVTRPAPPAIASTPRRTAADAVGGSGGGHAGVVHADDGHAHHQRRRRRLHGGEQADPARSVKAIHSAAIEATTAMRPRRATSSGRSRCAGASASRPCRGSACAQMPRPISSRRRRAGVAAAVAGATHAQREAPTTPIATSSDSR